MQLAYLFPEPYPLARARGVQVASAVAALCRAGANLAFAHVPGEYAGHPLAYYGVAAPATLTLQPLSNRLPAPFARLPVRSSKLFAGRAARWLARMRPAPVAAIVRHIKLAAALVRQAPAIPLVYEAHEVFADTASASQRERIAAAERAVMAGARLVVANSRGTAQRLEVLYRPGRPVRVLHNGVELPGTPPAKRRSAPCEHVVYTGSLFGWKGAEDLVAAAAQLKGFRIALYGGDPDQVHRLRASLPATGARVELLGQRPHDEILAALDRARIAVLPNRPVKESEFTSPMKLFEYMAHGCAIVASDLPAIREVADDAFAAWFTAGDARSLASTLRRLAADPARVERMGAAAAQRAAAFSWDARAEKLLAWIREVV